MNRRGFLKFIPAFASIPFVGRLFSSSVGESELLESDGSWSFVSPRCRCVISDDRAIVSNHFNPYEGILYADVDGVLITETNDGAKFKRTISRVNGSLEFQTLKMNAAGRWEPATGWTPYNSI